MWILNPRRLLVPETDEVYLHVLETEVNRRGEKGVFNKSLKSKKTKTKTKKNTMQESKGVGVPGDLYLLLTESIFRNELVKTVIKFAYLSVLGLVVGRSITVNPG